MTRATAPQAERPADYDRIRKEITAYDEIARLRLEQGIKRLADRLIGRDLLARYGQRAPVDGFPLPASLWLDSRSNPVSLLDAFKWLAPIKDTSFLQLGGSGSHAIKALMGGASRAWLLTPMAEEAALASRLDEYIERPARLEIVRGIGEHLPFASASIDRIFGGGTLHHIRLAEGLAEVGRVLKPGGRAAFVDPNLNFIYRLLELTRIRNLARERGAQCYPLRVPDIYGNALGFQVVQCALAGGPLRYAIVGMTRILKVKVPLSLSLTLQSIETSVLLKLRLRSLLGGLAVLVEK